jgi:hypothetical protein
MFGFRSRMKYNATVDIKLNNEYNIKTQDNPLFPGVLKYLELIDASWNNNASEDECALQIATLYLCGLIRGNLVDDAKVLAGRVDQVAQYGVDRNLIRQDIWDKCIALVQKNQRETLQKPRGDEVGKSVT